MASTVRVYRLNVTLPPGSDDPEWEPPGWTDDDHYAGQAFQWPRVTRYLSMSKAQRRADLLRKYGATVTVECSLPVTWPADGLRALYGFRDGHLQAAINHAAAEWARGEYEKRQAAASGQGDG